MDLLVSFVLFGGGVGLVLFFSELLVDGAVATSRGFGVTAFLISVVFIGFDPENLAVGAVGSYEGLAGIALGSILGSALVAVALAFGITALLAPMRFDRVPRRVVAVPVVAVLLAAALTLDGVLSRMDGGMLLLGYAVAVVYLMVLERGGVHVVATPEREEKVERLAGERGRWVALAILVASVVGVVVGGELVVRGSERLMARFGLTDTVFGMTILALVVSIEEVGRELPAALRGRPDITAGNVVGSVLAFFLFNAGVIALVRPVPVSPQVLRFHLPMAVGGVLLTSGLLLTRRVPRWAGGLLVLLYAGFFVGAYLLG